MVIVANAIVDEDAVVVEFGDAAFTDAAVLGASGFEVVACFAVLAGMENCPVVRVEGHLLRMIGWCYVTRIGGCREVEKYIWE